MFYFLPSFSLFLAFCSFLISFFLSHSRFFSLVLVVFTFISVHIFILVSLVFSYLLFSIFLLYFFLSLFFSQYPYLVFSFVSIKERSCFSQSKHGQPNHYHHLSNDPNNEWSATALDTHLQHLGLRILCWQTSPVTQKLSVAYLWQWRSSWELCWQSQFRKTSPSVGSKVTWIMQWVAHRTVVKAYKCNSFHVRSYMQW